MKIKTLLSFILLSIFFAGPVKAAERTVTSVIQSMALGATLESEMKKGPVKTDSDFYFVKKDSRDIALYLNPYIAATTDHPHSFSIIGIISDPNKFYAPNLSLPEGKYKLIGKITYDVPVRPNGTFTGSVDILIFEEVK